MNKKAFTLAEVLITLAIIGVVAAIAIPSVISNAQQQEFKTGLRKAVSVLNSAITMNIALDGESPYDNHDLFRYLQRHMSVMKTEIALPYSSKIERFDGTRILETQDISYTNTAFYTTDGMRFEFYTHQLICTTNSPTNSGRDVSNLHESELKPHMCATLKAGTNPNFKCGSYGLANNPNNTTATPCMVTVDVNGDRKPYPVNVNARAVVENIYKVPNPSDKKVKDMFSIIITEDRAIPYGVLAQKAMYQAQK